MSIEPGRLRHAIQLATGETTSPGEGLRLAGLLGVVEEILPYLLLRRDGFATSPKILDALAEARARAPGGARTARPITRTDAVQVAAVAAEVKAALKASIDRDLADGKLNARVDDAMRRFALLNPDTVSEPHLRIRAAPFVEAPPEIAPEPEDDEPVSPKPR